MRLIRLYDRVALKTALPGEKLAAGDIGTVVHVDRKSKTLDVAFEFFTPDGEDVTVVTVKRVHVRFLKHLRIAQTQDDMGEPSADEEYESTRGNHR